MTNVITREHIDRSMSYAAFRDLISSLLIERKTTGPKQSKELVQYTRLNVKLMDRIDKQTVIIPELMEALNSIKEQQIWVGLVEAWCGDVAQCLPPIAKMAVSVPKVSMRLLLRDEHPEVMNAYLTKSSRSIPKIIALKKDTLEELWTWGPRPEPAQKLFFDLRKKDEPFPVIAEAVQQWYNEDNNQTLQREILDILLRTDA